MISLISFTPAAHAASTTGTITITPTTGTPSYVCADGICDFTTTVTVSGTGFPSGQDDIDVCFVSTTQTAAVGCTNGIDLANNGDLFDQTIAGTVFDTVQADANGNFKVQFYAPIAYGGTYNVYAYYTPSSGVPVTTPVAVFTLTAAMAVEDQTTLTNSGIPGQPFDIIVVGLGAASAAAGEGVQLIPSSFFAGTWSGLTVGSVLGVNQGVFEEDAGVWITGALGEVTSAVTTAGTTAAVLQCSTCDFGVANALLHDFLTYTSGPAAGKTEQITASTEFTITTAAFAPAPDAKGDTFIVTTVAPAAAPSIGSAVLPTLPSGSTSIEGLGLTTGTIATTTFTTTPSIILYGYIPSCTGAPLVSILSIPTAAGNKFCMSGVGFAKSSTIAAPGSVTVGGASTIEGAVITTSTGTFGPLPVTLSSATSVGALTISFDGMNFNWANANIESPGILLGSNLGQGALTYMSETTGYVGDIVYIFGFGYSAGVTPEFQFAGVLATTATTNLIVAEDGNGAFETSFTVPALPFTTPACIAAVATCYAVHDLSGAFGANIIASASTAGTTASTIFDTALPFISGDVGDYLTFTAGPATGLTAEITGFVNTGEVTVSPSFSVAPGLNAFTVNALATNANTAPDQTFTIKPEASFGGVIGSIFGIYSSFGYSPALTISGFATTDNVMTVTMNGVTWDTIAGVAALDGAVHTYILPVIGATPATDFPGGSYNVNASGTTGGNWAKTTNTLTILPIQAESAGVGAISALSINYGNAGESVALLSTTAGGIHGLAPSTSYTIMWDGATQVGSFTSTPAGEVPVGISFVVPAGTAGFHIIDIQAAGTSAIYANQLTTGQQFGGCGFVNPCDLIFHLLPLLTATPSLVGATEIATVVGNGLPSNTLLYVVAPNSVSYASFTSTSTGAVPSSTTFTVPAQATFTTCGVHYCAGGELGTLITWNIENAQSQIVGEMQYVYGAVATLSASSGSAGSSVTITANGLNAPVAGNVIGSNSPYDVVFNCIPSSLIPDACTGISSGATPANIIIGALIPNALGAASTTITIPTSATSGTYVIQLVGASGAWDLAIPATFTVGAPSGVGDTTLTPGAPTQNTLNQEPDVQLTYTNTLTSSSINIVGYAVVTNGLGQVVLYTTSETTLAASGSQTLYFVLAGLPAASYTVTVYAISSTGLVVSQTTTTTAVIS